MLLLVPLARVAVGEDDDVVGPLQELEGEADDLLPPADDADALIAALEAVAVGAVVDGGAVVRLDLGNVGQRVADAVRQDDASRAEHAARGGHLEDVRVPFDLRRALIDDLRTALPRLGAAALEELARLDAVLSEEAVDPTRGRIAGTSVVEEQDGTAIAREKDCAGKAGGTAADDDCVVRHLSAGRASEEARPALCKALSTRMETLLAGNAVESPSFRTHTTTV